MLPESVLYVRQLWSEQSTARHPACTSAPSAMRSTALSAGRSGIIKPLNGLRSMFNKQSRSVPEYDGKGDHCQHWRHRAILQRFHHLKDLIDRDAVVERVCMTPESRAVGNGITVGKAQFDQIDAGIAK